MNRNKKPDSTFSVYEDVLMERATGPIERDSSVRPCSRPVSDPSSVAICGNCGRLLSVHQGSRPSVVTDSYRRDMWAWMFLHGGVQDRYGDAFEVDTIRTRDTLAHMIECSLDGHVKSPKVDFATSWGGTFGEDSHVEAITGTLTCACGQVRHQGWVAPKDITLSEIIYAVVNMTQEG